MLSQPHYTLNSKTTFTNKNLQNTFELFAFIILIKNIYKGFLPHSDFRIITNSKKDDLLTRFISSVFAQML